jgi:BlaI family penicillinase repressor
MKELTKAEEQVMQYVWKLKKAFLKDIVAEFPEPKPAYTTVSTVIRVLVKKGFLAYNSYSKVHEYYAIISKSEYFKIHFKGILKSFFNGSATHFASYFTENEDLSLSELEEIKQLVNNKLEEKKNDEPK